MGAALEGILNSPERKLEFLSSLRRIALRALNDTQLLILRRLEKEIILQSSHEGNGKRGKRNAKKSLNAILQEIARRHGKSISTLKMNAKILRELGLIDYGDREERKPVELTSMGRAILEILEVGR